MGVGACDVRGWREEENAETERGWLTKVSPLGW